MSADTLPEDPAYVFCPEPAAGDAGVDPCRILILVEDMTVAIPTALVALTRDHGVRLCDRLNRRLGFDNAAWTATARRFMRRADGHGRTMH